MKRRSLMKAAGVGALALTLAACSGGGTPAPAESGPTETQASGGGSLVVWMDENRASALEPVIAEFEEATGTTVEVIIKEFNTLAADFITQAPSGDGPDIVLGPHDAIGKLVQNGVAEPIELGDAVGDFQEVGIEAMSNGGSVYGVPVSIESIALVRNTALAPEAPATWDELVQVGEAAVAAGDAEYPVLIGLDPNAADPYHLYPLQASFGGPIFGVNEDGSYNADDLQMGNEGNLEFAEALAAWGESGVLNLNISQDIAKEQFASGASPFTITGPWSLEQFDDAGIEYAIDPIPAAGDLPATPFVGVQGFFLSAYSQNPIVATQFLTDYIASEEAQTAIYEAGDRAPALTAAFDAAQSNETVAAFGEVGAEGVPMPNIPEMDAVWADWGAIQAQIISGQAADPAAAWADLAASIQSTIDG
ncbi:extracellular solute-binding protein [Agrococcus sp. 1P02AA]|uniref:sugar ABC transporter substrate-binding protein n=1 Tax=Agrococcus sp. 1P02AA TaxID=3132259 RepID=UPI0039A52D6E